MSTPPKPTSLDLINVTVVSTPMPQASSTVQRKGTFDGRMSNRDYQGSRYKRDKDTSQTSNSSLGILDNISSLLGDVSDVEDKQRTSIHKMDVERELARRLLQKCSESRTSSFRQETNKENDFNMQNMNSNKSVNQSTYYEKPNNGRGSMAQRQSGKAQSVVFELDEITARSSSLSRSPDKSLPSQNNTNSGGISFDTTAQELMAQFQHEEFHPASEMASQMLADEALWQENCSYGVPVATNAEKEYLDLSCFSGIIGELDLSIESCAGRKVSVGEFFQRKCGNIGMLSTNDADRPSFGFSIKSPTKKDKRVALVDSTIMTEASSVHKENEPVPAENSTKNIGEHNIMSLSSIAQALQDIDNGTPRRLVDQLIMATKKKKHPQLAENVFPGDTFTMLPSSRNSMPVTPMQEGLRAEKEDFPTSALKLSLDSKTLHELSNSRNKLSKMMSYSTDLNIKTNESLYMTHEIPQKDTSNVPSFSKGALLFNEEKPTVNVKTMFQDSQINDESFVLYQNLSKNRKMESTLQNQSLDKKDVIKQENISYDSKDPTMDFSASRVDSDVIISKSAEELCCCIVGIPRTTNIELTNKADRWIICCLSLHQIQGDKQAIVFRLPKDIILIKPHASQTVQVNVEIVKICAPIIVVLNIVSSDMVTRSEWSQKHILCFQSEELKVNINTHSPKCELDFQCIANNCTATLPITLENKNSMDLPIRLSIVQSESKTFYFDENEMAPNNDQNVKQVLLKTMGQHSLNLLCKGCIPHNNETDLARKQLFKSEGTLMIQIEKEESDSLTIKEIPLVVETGICRIDIVETEKSLLISKKQSKSLNVLNSGSVPTTVAACIVEDEGSSTSVADFSVKPDSLFLKRNEIGTFTITYKPSTLDTRNKLARIKITAGNNVCYHAIIGEQSSENQNEMLRCETPQFLVPASSPTSPHSIASGRTGVSGRNSPGSTASGATVAGDKIPIRATHAVLVWNCVKAGKSEIKEFAIRNTSENKIRIQASISDNDKSFKFLRERQAPGTSIILSMQRMESKTLTVVYTPHRIGASSGKITLRHYEVHGSNNESRPSKAIFLNGYGGCGKVEISEAFKDTSGKMWLSLGTLNSEGSLKAKIRLQNTGDLCSYAKIKLTPKAVYPAMVSSWQVEPTELVLNPNDVQWVMLEFRPRKEDLALLKRADVSHVGTITVTHGDEPTRWRIRRLYNKMKETGELRGSENEAFRNVVYPICRAFPGEQLLPDLTIVRDSIQNLGDLCRGVQQHEIMLTMEVCADETLSILHDEADDSQMFYSLCSDNSHVYEPCGESFLPSQTMGFHETALHHQDFEDQLAVKPSVVTLMPPIKIEATVTISTSSKVAEPFETMLSNTDLLTVLPAEGMIPAARGFPLKIQCRRRVDRSFEALLEICTENSKQDVLIKVSAMRQ